MFSISFRYYGMSRLSRVCSIFFFVRVTILSLWQSKGLTNVAANFGDNILIESNSSLKAMHSSYGSLSMGRQVIAFFSKRAEPNYPTGVRKILTAGQNVRGKRITRDKKWNFSCLDAPKMPTSLKRDSKKERRKPDILHIQE